MATSEEKVAELLADYDFDGDGRLIQTEVALMIAESGLSFEDSEAVTDESEEEE